MKSGWLISALRRRLDQSSSFRDMTPMRQGRLTIYVPLTTQNRGSKYEVELPKLHFLREMSVANVQGVGSLTTSRLERRMGEVPPNVLRQVRVALAFAGGIA